MKILIRVFALALCLSCVFVSCQNTSGLPSGPIQVTKKLIDSPLDDIQWADLETVFVLTERGKVYRSVDGGKGWTNQASKLHAASSNPTVRSVHISRADPRKIFFMGTQSENWITTDMGKTYKPTPDIDLHEVKLHPVQSNWILGASMSTGCKAEPKMDCYKVLYFSQDFGETWSLAENYVVQFDWAPGTESSKNPKILKHEEVFAKDHVDPPATEKDHVIYATVHANKEGNQKFGMWDKNINFHASYDFFKTSVQLVEHGNRFLFGEHSYLFVAAVNPNQENQVSLQVSREEGPNKKFQTALLPVDLTEHSYTILDTSEGSVFLHVNHAPFDTNAPTGHVYISDWSGTRFSLSLPYNHRSPDGKCDFEKVEGLEGIYLANFIDEDASEASTAENFDSQSGEQAHGGASQRKHLRAKTVITFDKGGIWSYLEPPTKDTNGNAIKCDQGCHLHLHGITDLYGPFYSSATATGIIMSTGTVGQYLQESMDQINTYLSRDAGLTWFEVAKGSHIYEFGDHGGLIVMAYDEGETDSILYTWDQGLTWRTLKISDSALQVENIIIEPAATSEQFIVYGWQDDSGVLIFLDFAELHERECQGRDAADSKASDYENWSPSDGRLGGKCLLGHRVSYVRRKRESQCFNPDEFERATVHEPCACTPEDFECDYGYMRQIQGGPCVPDPDAEPAPQEPCVDFYYTTKGYRRVAGDTCISGEQWDRVQVPCPMWTGNHFGKGILILLVLVVISLAVATFYNKSEFVEDTVDWIKGLFQKSGYELVGRDSAHHADDDYSLDDQEFGQSAHLIKDDGHDKNRDDDFNPRS